MEWLIAPGSKKKFEKIAKNWGYFIVSCFCEKTCAASMKCTFGFILLRQLVEHIKELDFGKKSEITNFPPYFWQKKPNFSKIGENVLD